MKSHRLPNLLALLSGALIATAALSPAPAATFTWNPASNTGGTTFSWSSGTNWLGGSPATSGSTTTLEFITSGSGGTYTLSNDNAGTFQLNSLRLAGPISSSNQGFITGNQLRFVDNGGVTPTILQDGALQFNINGTGGIATDTLLTLSGTGTGQVSIGAAITGTGSILMNPGASVSYVLTNTNSTFSGGLTVNSGKLVVQASSTLTSGTIKGPFGAGTVALNGGSLRSAGASQTVHNSISFGGNVTIGDGSTFTKNLTVAGPVTIAGTGATRVLAFTGSSSTTQTIFSGVIDDAGGVNGLTITGTTNGGFVEFNGTGANTYSGLTTLSGSNITLNLNKTGVNAIAGGLTINSATGSAKLGQSNQIADLSAVTVTNGSLDLNGNSDTVGAFSTATTGTLLNNGTSAGTLTVGGTASIGTVNQILGKIQDGTGTVALIKQGTDTLQISGSNAFSGGLTVTSGGLVISNNFAAGTSVIKLNGGQFRSSSTFSGTMSNAIEIGANMQFGSTTPSTGQLNLTGSTTLIGTGATRSLTLSATGGAVTPIILSGAIGDGGNGNGITLGGIGTLEFAGSASNTYTGLTTVNNASATLNLNKSGGATAIAGNLTLASGAVAFQSGNQIADSATVTVNGSTFAFAANGTTGAGVAETIANLSVTNGILNTDPSAASGNTVAVTGTTSVTGGVLRVNPSSTLNAGTVTVNTSTLNALRVGGKLIVGSGGLTLVQPDTGGSAGFFDIMRLAAEDGNGANLTAGTLQLDGNVTLVASSTNTNGFRITTGGLASTVDVHGGTRTFTVPDGAADADLTINSALSDSIGGGGISKTGAGVMALANGGNFGGLTTVLQGTLRYSTNNVLGGAVTINGATAVFDLNNNTDSVGTVTLDGGGTIMTGTAGGLGSTGNYELKSGVVDVGLSGSTANLNKTTGGLVVLKRQNSFGGETTLAGGTTSIVLQSVFSTGAIHFNGGTLRVDSTASGNKSLSNALNIGGDITVGDATSALSLTFSGTTTLVGGTHTITTNDSNTTLSGPIGDGGNGYGLTKNGDAALILTGTSTYAGATEIDAGKLIVNGGISGSTVTVAAPATLSGSGTIATSANSGNAIDIAGTLSPADTSTGNLHVTLQAGAKLNFATGSVLRLDLGEAGSSDAVIFSTADDWLSGSGVATLSLNGTIDYNSTYTVLQNVTTAGFTFSAITGYDSFGYSALFEQDGSDYKLSFVTVPVPEPATWASVLSGFGFLLAFQRSRRHRN